MYYTARERWAAAANAAGPVQVCISPRLEVVVREGADRRRANLPVADEVALLIPDEYAEASFRDVILAERTQERS